MWISENKGLRHTFIRTLGTSFIHNVHINIPFTLVIRQNYFHNSHTVCLTWFWQELIEMAKLKYLKCHIQSPLMTLIYFMY